MVSVDKLRGIAHRMDMVATMKSEHGFSPWAIKLRDIADEIEREVKALADERDLLKTQWEAGVDFDQRLEAAADKREDVTLFGVDYTPLPVDADGVPIHVGDVLEWTSGDTLEVIGFGGETLFYIDKNYNDSLQWTQASTKQHHRAPTVEDVLREFYVYAVRGKEAHAEDVDGAVLAEYATRLRLAGEDA